MAIALPRNGSMSLATMLLWVTVAWNVIEGVVAGSSGVLAGSVALIGFGLDSLIEVTAALVLLWRLRLAEGDQHAEERERLAHRVVGVTFLVLAAYILAQVAYTVGTGHEPEGSSVGLTLATLSLVIMPVIGLVKRVNAQRIGSRALVAESMETIVCSYLSLTLFVGLGANASFGWWWADIAAAITMVPWIVREGLEGALGESEDDR